MVSQIYFLKCLQISFTQIKHTCNDSAALNKLPVIWNSIAYLKKEREKSLPSGPFWLHKKVQSQSFRTQSGNLRPQWAVLGTWGLQRGCESLRDRHKPHHSLRVRLGGAREVSSPGLRTLCSKCPPLWQQFTGTHTAHLGRPTRVPQTACQALEGRGGWGGRPALGQLFGQAPPQP